MKRNFLTDLGLEAETVDKIMAEHGKTVNDYKEDADKAKRLEKQIEDKDNEITKRDDQLEELKKKSTGDEELQKEINRLESENEQSAKDFQKKLDDQAFDFAIEKALRDQKVHNPRAAKALLDTESIKLDGQKLLGFEDQITALKESDAYLFEQEDTTPAGLKGRTPYGGGQQPPTDKNPFSKEHYNLTEQGRLFKEDPEKYKLLKAQAN
ncbi:phage scaffolding protein [Geomicrobium sp. JCM 19055]|uniref:phage scaffolding protein n=1 Tax=Geomicrobium sp. JCM 19055 TaxID=1460649 RepID=UPI00045ED64F|nr:phage scaffolding protein [Geomicrobium sp. JCM 19055]GAK01499.1 phage capsid and scaffold [Geomicrobium sp. JCM 19055]